MTRQATKREINNYNKVEKLLTMEEIDLICDLLDDEIIFGDLVHNRVNNADINAIIKAHKISARQLSDWYFIEVEETLYCIVLLYKFAY
jgi:hypothetical protein